MDELSTPAGGSDDALVRVDDERALALYRAAHPEWSERVTAAQFLEAHPLLAEKMQRSRASGPRTPAEWLRFLALPLVVLALIAALVIARDWKLAHLFAKPAQGEDPARTLEVRPLASNAMPTGSAVQIRAINEALAEKPLNWSTVLTRATALHGDAEAMRGLRATPAAYAWLHEVLAMAHVQLAEREPHRVGHWGAVLRLEREFAAPEVPRPFGLAFAACVALFERAGGSRDLYIGQPSAVPPEQLLDAVSALRSRYPAELAKSPERQRQLARVECYTLLRRIEPKKVRWLSYAPFDETDPANRETWTQLARAMQQWRQLEGDAPSADLDQLQRVFWQTIDRFCTWPTRWKDDFVTIGNHDYTQADARAALAEIAVRRGER